MKRSIIVTVLGLLVGLLTIVSPAATSGAATTGFRAFAWGANDSGQLGGVPTTKRSSPVQIGTVTNWASITAGGDLTLGIKTDGTLWAWGYNGWGQLGDGTTTNRTSPVQIGTATNWASVTTGGFHSLGIKTDGTLWAWGHNGYGQLGDSTYTDSTSPVQVGTATNWASVTTGGSHSLALKADGTLWAWGSNGYGELGDGTTTERPSPVQIGTATNWTSITAGGDHTLGIKTDGTLWAWGNNEFGELGDGTTTERISPVQIGTATDWASITAGEYHSLALKTDGTLWAWGQNVNGQLGDGTTTNRTSPVQIGTATSWASITAGSYHSLALKTDGTLWAWGQNGNGRLGDGTTTNRTSPVQIGTATKWASITAGYAHSLGLREDPIGPPFTPSPAFISTNPTGSFDLATQYPGTPGIPNEPYIPGGARIEGWALDPESPEPISLHIYVDGAFAGSRDADTDRPDVGQVFPGYGNAHGFDAMVEMSPGFHTVCAYGINIGAGENALVGCRWVMIETNPFGSFDLGTMAPGGARIAGWALHPQSTRPVVLHIYVDGSLAAALAADADRPDVGQAFPGYGNARGFDAIVGIQPGFHTVCAYGINIGGGENPLIGCRWVMIESNPFGSLDVVQSVNGGIQVGGWTLDPQTSDSIEIHVYVDGAIAGSFIANTNRPDVGQAFPGYGNAHGFDNVISATPGPHQVCVYGINKLAGENALVGCRNT